MVIRGCMWIEYWFWKEYLVNYLFSSLIPHFHHKMTWKLNRLDAIPMESLIKSICTTTDLVQTTDLVFSTLYWTPPTLFQSIAHLERNCGHNLWLTKSKWSHQRGENLMGVAGHLVTSTYFINGLQQVPCASTTSQRPKNLFWICEGYLKDWSHWWNVKKNLGCHLQVPSLLFFSHIPPLDLQHALLLHLQRLLQWRISILFSKTASSLLLSASFSSIRTVSGTELAILAMLSFNLQEFSFSPYFGCLGSSFGPHFIIRAPIYKISIHYLIAHKSVLWSNIFVPLKLGPIKVSIWQSLLVCNPCSQDSWALNWRNNLFSPESQIWMNFRKNSKRHLTPPLFRKTMLRFFSEDTQICNNFF